MLKFPNKFGAAINKMFAQIKSFLLEYPRFTIMMVLLLPTVIYVNESHRYQGINCDRTKSGRIFCFYLDTRTGKLWKDSAEAVLHKDTVLQEEITTLPSKLEQKDSPSSNNDDKLSRIEEQLSSSRKTSVDKPSRKERTNRENDEVEP